MACLTFNPRDILVDFLFFVNSGIIWFSVSCQIHNSNAEVIIVVESWLLELMKGIGRGFLNPLLYWSFLLILIVGYKRIQRERNYFGVKIFNAFSEWKNTWMVSIVAGLFISLLTIGLGIVYSHEVILVLSTVVIILSLT